MGVYLGAIYQEVEYIQSTATNPGADNSSGQYIDTLYTHNPNTKISIDIQFTTTAKQQRFFGVSTANSSYSTFAAYINGSTQWARATKDGDGNWQTTSVSADTNRHTFVLQNSNYVIYTNGATTYSGNNGNTMTKGGSHTLPLLCTWGDGEGKYLCHASAKLYSCKIWDNGTLVRDFVPCYRKSDNVIGLFDRVENKFYTNSGTGTFTKGNDVGVLQPELKNAYIGEYHEYTFDFQNEGSLNWTAQSVYGTPTLTSGQGWTIGSSSSGTYQSAIMPPSSVYGGTLKKFVLYIYKGVSVNADKTVGAGVGTSNLSIMAGREQVVTQSPRSRAMVYDGAEHYTTTQGATGEITLQYIFNDDGSLVLKVNDAEYNLGQYASIFRTARNNQNLGLSIGRWRVADGNIYIRKVEITTA